MRTIIYLRTSTEEQNPENQLKDCKSFSEGLKLDEFEVFQEKQSAFKDDSKREVFNNILKEIKKGKVDHIIVWDWDRLFRNRNKLIQFFELCKIYKCKIHSSRQGYFEDFYKIPAPFDEIVSNLVLNLMGHMAEEESKKKSDRVKLAVIKEEGKVTKSYKGNKWGRKEIPTKVAIRIIELCVEGLSIRKIAEHEDIFYWDKNNNKKQLGKSTVHKIISENKGKNN